jgi:outer membrane receptor for ferric coprogen and ferric-rhodotorulic acid
MLPAFCPRFGTLCSLVVFPFAVALRAQSARTSTVTEEAVTFSPFEVRTDEDTGYTASSTLAGSRLNTALHDTPASISVFTKEFIDDTGCDQRG